MSTRLCLSAFIAIVALNACSNASPVPTKLQPATQSVAAVTPSRTEVREKLARHREEQIQRLHAYAESGAFPHNYASKTPLHMFKDEAGRLCAVANLVDRDGLTALVDRTSRERNDVSFSEVKDGELFDWAIDSGLTIEEIARIQRPAPMIHLPTQLPATQAKYFPKPTKPTPAVASEDAMKRDVRAILATVESELRAATEKSLEIAADRWLQRSAKLTNVDRGALL